MLDFLDGWPRGAFKSVQAYFLAWPLEVYNRDPMSWKVNPQSGFIELAKVSQVHWVWLGVEREEEALCVLWICDSMSKSLSLKVAWSRLKDISEIPWQNASARVCPLLIHKYIDKYN